MLPSPNQGGVPRGLVRARAFRFKSKDVDLPTRMQTVNVGVTFSRGKVTRKVTCKVIIVHAGKSEKKEKGGKRGKGKGKSGQAKPPKIPPLKCEGGCGGAPPPTPPAKGTTLTDYDLHPDGTARVHVTPTDPLEGLTIPLLPPNPVPVDPPKVTAGSGPIECELIPLELKGGPAAEHCRLIPPGPPEIDSFFDIFYDVSLRGQISGTLDRADGTPVESFTAPPAPPPPLPQPIDEGGLPPAPSATGSGTLTPGSANANAVDFDVEFAVQNTTLTRFLIQVPMSMKVVSGGASGFTCAVVDFKVGVERAIECEGAIESGQSIQGGFELNGPRPSQLTNSTKLFGFAGESEEYGPFNLNQAPNPSGSGMFSGAGNTRNFTVTLNAFAALDEFLLDFPEGVQVQSGSVSAPACHVQLRESDDHRSRQRPQMQRQRGQRPADPGQLPDDGRPGPGCPGGDGTVRRRPRLPPDRAVLDLRRPLAPPESGRPGKQRRGWDSNPRAPCDANSFRDCPVQPLRHPSGISRQLMLASAIGLSMQRKTGAVCSHRRTTPVPCHAPPTRGFDMLPDIVATPLMRLPMDLGAVRRMRGGARKLPPMTCLSGGTGRRPTRNAATGRHAV